MWEERKDALFLMWEISATCLMLHSKTCFSKDTQQQTHRISSQLSSHQSKGRPKYRHKEMIRIYVMIIVMSSIRYAFSHTALNMSHLPLGYQGSKNKDNKSIKFREQSICACSGSCPPPNPLIGPFHISTPHHGYTPTRETQIYVFF